MNRLRKRKGMTLTEVIIALIIISVIVVGVLRYFSSGYVNIMRLRGINIENFAIQKYFEEEMAEAKRTTGTGTETLQFTYKMGDSTPKTIDVKGTTLTYDKTSRNIHLFVSNQREATLQIPEDLTVTIKDARPYYYLNDSIPAGNVELPVNNIAGISISSSGSWLLSNRSLGADNLVPVANMVKSNGTIAPSRVQMPKMTEDFKDLPTSFYPASGFKVTNKMLGKYLTFGGRAINTYGRVGSFQTADDRIWLMGIPVVDSLRDHMDADLITTDGGGPIVDPVTVRFPNHRTGQTYTQTTTIKSVTDIPGSKDSSVLQSRQVAALGTHNPLQFWGNDLSKGNTLSLLLTNDTQTGDLLRYRIGSNINWVVNIDDNRYLTVGLVNSSGADSIDKTTQVAQLEENKDNSIQVRTTVTNSVLKLELILNGRRVDTKELRLTSNHNVSNATILIGGNTHINEFANFYKALTDEEIQKMADYFAGKYSTDYNAKQP